MAGRPPIGDKPMSSTERMRRLREKAKEAGVPMRNQLLLALGRAVVEISRSESDAFDVTPVIRRAEDILIEQNFKRRPAREALNRILGGGA